MPYVWFFLLGLLAPVAQAEEGNDLRILQVQADLPTLTLWANLPSNEPIERNQLNVSLGDHPAKVFGIDHFRQTGEGIGYIFLVDISRSLRSRQLVQIKRALHHWIAGMNAKDRASLVTFGHEMRHDFQFTHNRFKLTNAINMLAITDAETSLYHGLLEAINVGRSRQPNLPIRRAIILLSDGIGDGPEGTSLDDVIRQIREYRVPIYSIGFVTEPLTERKRKGLEVLNLLSSESGGYFIQADINRLDRAYQQQYERITQAYRLRIDCPDCVADGKLHHVHLTWNDGRRTLSDDLDIRLTTRQETSHPRRHSDSNNDGGWAIFIFAIGLLAFFLALLWLYRDRLTWPSKYD
ncbi:vWA domain-containing protein [Methylomonas sp. MgM2]